MNPAAARRKRAGGEKFPCSLPATEIDRRRRIAALPISRAEQAAMVGMTPGSWRTTLTIYRTRYQVRRRLSGRATIVAAEARRGGISISVYANRAVGTSISHAILREIGAAPGDRLRVTVRGDAIVIRKVA
mgnify:FL=1